jgi:putative Mn2+ efflux pump MntP
MEVVNLVLVIIGSLVALIGIISFFVPALTRIINAPGGPRLKAIISLITGIILVLIGLIVEIPTG